MEHSFQYKQTDYCSVYNKCCIDAMGQFSSYHYSSELKTWIATGKNGDDFFPNYNFHDFYRTLGRSLLM